MATTTPAVDLEAVRLAQVPAFCPGTGAVLARTYVDGGGNAQCPECKRWRYAFPIPDDGLGRHTVEAHGPVLPRRTPGAFLHLFDGAA